MDYEKKYKEALELARVAAFNGHQSLMEGIFPELAESEDEKTRKRIIALVNAHGQGMYKDDMLAWLENIPYTIDHEKREGFHLGYKAGLEKQGEKSLTVDIESMIEAYEQRLINQGNGVRNSPIVNMCVAAFKHGVENTLDELHLKQGETSPILSNSSNIGKDEQKPAWSEEDEKILKDILVDVKFEGYNNDMLANSYKKINWLKSLKEKFKIQTRQGISKEDEYSFMLISGLIRQDQDLSPENKNKLRLWLKSIIYQSRWKPSDEQMKALDSVIDEYDGYPEFDSLVSLKNDLRKL